jgi:ABC-type lipoprotein release transport system permease subunit
MLTWLRIELRRRWRALFVLALLIAISAGTVLAALAGARRAHTAIDRLAADTLPATAAVLPNQPGFDWAKVRALPEVEALSEFAVTGFEIPSLPAAQNEASFPFDDQALNTLERPVVLDGRLADPARADEAMVSPQFVKTYGLGVGDTVTIRLATPETTDAGSGNSDMPAADGPEIVTRIVGVIRSPWFHDPVESKGGFVPSAGLLAQYRKNLLGNGEKISLNALVRLRGGADALPKFREDLAAVSGRSDIELFDQAQTAAREQRTNSFESASLLGFALAALVAAIVLVGQAIARYTAASVADLQTLRAVGMTPTQAVLAAIAGPAVVGVLGTTVGIGAAVVASQLMPIGAAAGVEPRPGIDADWLVLGVGWAALAFAVIGGAAVAAWLALAAARAGVGSRRSTVARAVTAAGLPVPVVIGTRFALEPGRGRGAVPVRPALLGAVTGVLGVLAAFTFSAGVSDSAAAPERFGRTYQVEGFFGFNGQDPGPVRTVLEAIAADPDVAGVNDARQAVAEAPQASVTMYTHDPVGSPVPAVLTDGQLPTKAGEVALAATSARLLGVGVGDTVELTGNNGSAKHRLTVTGISFVPTGPHNGYDEGGWLTAAGYDAMFTGFKFHVAEIALRPGADPAVVIPRLSKSAGAAVGLDSVPLAAPDPLSAIAQIRDVQLLPVVLGGFLGLLAIGAVGHALATAVRRRRHDVAVLRAVGMTRWQSRGVVVTQATVLAVIGLALGIPLGLALGRTMWRIVADYTPVLYVPPVAFWALILVAPLALLIANLLATPPGQRAARLRIGHVLRAE